MDILEDINNIPEGLAVAEKFDAKKINIAKLITNDHHSYVYLADNKAKAIQSKDKETRMEPVIPYKNIERGVYYITGKSGTGKSLIALRVIATQYHKLYPQRNIFYCCATDLADDENFEEVKFIKPLNPLKIYSLDMPHEEEKKMIKELLSNSLVIFDDLDMAPNDQKKIYSRLQGKLIEVGRKFKISVCIISHLATNAHNTKMILNEIDLYFTFKDGLESNRLLTHYKKYKPEKLAGIKSQNPTWVCFNFRYNCVMTSHSLFLE